MEEDVSVAVVGAGPAGLAALRALTAAGLDAVAFERGARVGGVWTLEDRPTAAYRLAAPDHQPRAHGVRRAPDAAGHARLPEPRRGRASGSRTTSSASSLRDASGSAPRSTHARRRPDGGWELAVGTGGERVRRARRRQRPQRGRRAGPTRRIRASSPASSCTRSTTTTPADFAGRSVLVVGMGNSAMDIATDVSHFAARDAAVRRAAAAGSSPSACSASPPTRSSGRGSPSTSRGGCASRSRRRCCRLTVGRPEDVGLPAPDRRPVPVAPDDLRHDRLADRPRRDRAEAGDRGARRRRRALHRRQPRGGRRDRLVHGLPRRRSRSSTQALVGARPAGAAALQARPPPRRAGPLLRRADAVDRLGVPDPRAPVDSCSPSHLTGRWAPPRRARDARRLPSGAPRARSAAGAPHGRPTMRVDFDAYMHELGVELERGRRAGGAGVTRTAIVTGASGAIGSALVGGAARRAAGRVAGLDLEADATAGCSRAT